MIIKTDSTQCGTINSVKMFHGPDGNSEVSIIEFETKEEGLGALTRDQKLLDGNTIEVQLGTESTIFVTNFPPTADEGYIRDLFGKVRHASFLSTVC